MGASVGRAGRRNLNPNYAEARGKAIESDKSEADRHAAKVMPTIRRLQATGAKSLREIAGALNDLGVATARGKEWQAMTVMSFNLLDPDRCFSFAQSLEEDLWYNIKYGEGLFP